MESILGQALSMTTRHRSVPGAWHRADYGSVRTADTAGNERRETGAGTSHRLRLPHLNCQRKSAVGKQYLELVICDAVGKGPWSWAGGDWGSRRWAAPLQLCLDVPLGVLLPQRLKMDCWVFGQCYSLPHSQILPPFSGCYIRSKSSVILPCLGGLRLDQAWLGSLAGCAECGLVAPGVAFLRWLFCSPSSSPCVQAVQEEYGSAGCRV